MPDQARRWTPYRYAFDNPLRFIDPDGMFEYSDGYSFQESQNSTGAMSHSGSFKGGMGDLLKGSSAGSTVIATSVSGQSVEVEPGAANLGVIGASSGSGGSGGSTGTSSLGAGSFLSGFSAWRRGQQTHTVPGQDIVTQQDLIDLVSKNPMYSKYAAEWILDTKGLKTSESNPGKTIPIITFKDGKALSASKIKVYIHPSAFGSITDFRQTLVTGHEFIHGSHLSSGSYIRWINEFGQDGARAISEYWAYKWQVDNEVRLGYPLGGQVGLDKWTGFLPTGYKPR